MISVTTLVLLFWVHTFADFVVQTDTMAINKSKSNFWLTLHVMSYALFLLPFGFWFAVANFWLHIATDYVTSRITSRLWREEKRHKFFIVIGIDQALHLTALALTYYWIEG
jgi:hypothetical protein